MGTRMRLATLPCQPVRNENQRMVRTVFKRAELLDSSILAVEHSTYFLQGRSPLHAEDDSEELIYFRRGKGSVRVDDKDIAVGPGDTVAIPRSAEHCVHNTGADTLEHILISASLGPPATSARVLRGKGSVSAIPFAGLERLNFEKMVLEPGETSSPVDLADQEVVYSISSGFLVANVGLPATSYQWEYAIDSSNCMWLPPNRRHSFRNVGDCTAVICGFTSITDQGH